MKHRKNSFRSLTTISQFGINMIVPIFGCSFFGMYLDRKFGTSFIMILLFFLGAAAGFRNIYIMATRIGEQEAKEGREERRNASKSNKNVKR